MKKGWLVIVMVLILTIITVELVKAEEHIQVTKEDLTRVGRQLYAPGSEGATVDFCTLYTAQTMRSEIIGLLQKGYSDKEIINVMVEQYGEQVLAAPRKSGFNLSLWWLPILGVLGGILALAYFLRTKYRNGSSTIDREPFNEITEHEIIEIQEQLKVYLKDGSEHAYEALNPLYKDLADLKYDYLMDKVDDTDYESMKKSIYHEILVTKQRKEGEW